MEGVALLLPGTDGAAGKDTWEDVTLLKVSSSRGWSQAPSHQMAAAVLLPAWKGSKGKQRVSLGLPWGQVNSEVALPRAEGTRSGCGQGQTQQHSPWVRQKQQVPGGEQEKGSRIRTGELSAAKRLAGV